MHALAGEHVTADQFNQRRPARRAGARLLGEIAAEGNRARTRSKDAANEAFVLGVGSIKDMIEAKRQARQKAASGRAQPSFFEC